MPSIYLAKTKANSSANTNSPTHISTSLVVILFLKKGLMWRTNIVGNGIAHTWAKPASPITLFYNSASTPRNLSANLKKTLNRERPE